MRLVIIDGLDGVGKDTHAELVRKRYEEKGEKVIIRSHPESDNYFGVKTKKALLGQGKMNKVKASFFYMFDVLRSIRRYHRRKDIDTLIMVRYLIGTAYLPSKFANFGYNFFCGLVPTSKYMFFLDAPPEKLLERIKERSEIEIFETLTSLTKVRKKALGLVKNWNIIDTNCSIGDTYDSIEKVLDSLDNST